MTVAMVAVTAQPAACLGKLDLWQQIGHIGPAMFFAARKGVILTGLLNSYCADCALAKTAQQK
jgi:hypothetical protein